MVDGKLVGKYMHYTDLTGHDDGLFSNDHYSRRWFFKHLLFHPYLGKIPILTNIFQMGETTNQYWFIIRKMIVLEVPNCYRFAWLGFHKFHRSKRWIQSDLGPQNMFESLVFFCILMNNCLCFMSLSFIGISLFIFLDVISCLLCVLFSASWDFHYANPRLLIYPWLGEHVKPPVNLHGIKPRIFTDQHFFMFEFEGSMLVSGGVPGYHFWFSLVQFRHAICMATLIKPPRKLAVLKQTISSDIQNPFFLFKNLFKCVFFIFLSPKFAILDSLKEAGKKKNQGKAPITSGMILTPHFRPRKLLGIPFFAMHLGNI